jgi:tRNA (cytidine56-2'-O)-methyltransferase
VFGGGLGMEVVILRLGHRYVRDDRVTTHVFLTARAFGASKVIYAGQRDEKLEERIEGITKVWGGPFKVEYEKDWKQTIEKWKERGGEVVHLTVYGLPLQDVICKIRKSNKGKLVVVGGAKVPKIIYKLSDWNVSITSQPHSEISALSVFLHELFEGRELSKVFQSARLIVIPEFKGKKILQL